MIARPQAVPVVRKDRVLFDDDRPAQENVIELAPRR
jgi:hypothetical protein